MKSPYHIRNRVQCLDLRPCDFDRGAAASNIRHIPLRAALIATSAKMRAGMDAWRGCLPRSQQEARQREALN
jgi:hypothetical protein